MPIIQDVLDSADKIKELHRRKNDDYAASDNPFSNFDVSEYGLRLFKSARDQSFAWPIFNKFARLSTLLNSGNTPNNESIDDSLLDIATYVLLWKADLKRREEIRSVQDLVEAVGELPPLFSYACRVHNMRNCGACMAVDGNFYRKPNESK